MVWDALPADWTQAPHFGNAMIGSMLYLHEGALCLEIFRADVRDHRDDSHGWTAYSRPRFRIGFFTLKTTGTLVGCRWRKDLWNAELTGEVRTDRGRIMLRHFVHAQDMAIVTELRPSEGEQVLDWQWHPAEARTTRPGYPTDAQSMQEFTERYGEHHRQTLKPQVPNPQGHLEDRRGIQVWVQNLYAGGQYATAWKQSLAGSDHTLIVTIAKSYPDSAAADTAAKDIARFESRERESWTDAHRAWWHAYYPRSVVVLPDKPLEGLYWQSVYRLGCTSRAGRSFVDTSGLWFQGGPWPYVTQDWNTQAAHWGVYAANRLEQGEEIVRRLHAGSDNLIRAVLPEAWRSDSAYLALATAEDMAGGRDGDMRYYDLVGCLPWLLHNAWWQYRFSMDEAMLRETILPLLRRAVNLYLHLMVEDNDGSLHLQPTYSPETGVWKDANFDLALFKWGCHVLLHICERLQISDPLIPRWQQVVDKLVSFPADANGFMLGSEQTTMPHHRHLSHLLMIYPLYLVNRDQPHWADALRRSCELLGGTDGSDDGAVNKLHAMVEAHAGPIQAAIGDGDAALRGLQLLAGDLHPNGLWFGTPCIESTLAVINNIQNMLIQSWSDPASDEAGPIRIFPALPSSWLDVEFRDLRAEGAFLVSARRAQGRTVWVRVTSLAGEPCTIRTDMSHPRADAGSSDRVTELAPGLLRLSLEPNEQIDLHST